MFHLRVGEMIVTLQDMDVLLELLIDGPPGTGQMIEISQKCKRFLSREPPSIAKGTEH